jgi:hypothetical protein
MLNNQNVSINSQLDKLERISNQISLLISNNDYDKISHLDRMRKKIISDMQEKNLELSTNHKSSVLKLISQNEVIIKIQNHLQILPILKNVLRLI